MQNINNKILNALKIKSLDLEITRNSINLYFSKNSLNLHFDITYFPSNCGSVIFHNIIFDTDIDKDKLKKIANSLFKELLSIGRIGRSMYYAILADHQEEELNFFKLAGWKISKNCSFLNQGSNNKNYFLYYNNKY